MRACTAAAATVMRSQEQGDYDSEVHYTSQWSEVDVPSSGFKVRGHDNPRRKIPIYSSMETRPRPCIGAYALGEAAIAKADWWSECWVSEQTALPSAFTAAGARFFNGAIIVPSGNPQVAPGCAATAAAIAPPPPPPAASHSGASLGRGRWGG